MKEKAPKALALTGIIIFLIFNWSLVKFNEPEIFDITNETIIEKNINQNFKTVRIVIVGITLAGIIIETRKIIQKRKKGKDNFATEIIGICLNIFLLSLTIIPIWTFFYYLKS